MRSGCAARGGRSRRRRRRHERRPRIRGRGLRRVRRHPRRLRRDPRAARPRQAAQADRDRVAPPGSRGLSMPILVVGVSHHTARLEVRERLALGSGAAEDLLSELVSGGAVAEAVALSTCNRTELYLAAGDADIAERAAVGALARRAGLAPAALRALVYT